MTQGTTDERSFEHISTALADPGWVRVPDFLPADLVTDLQALLETRWHAGEFRHAGVGRGTTFQIRPEIRSDRVLWLDPTTAPAPVRRYLALMEDLRCYLNQSLFLALQEFESHFAIYPRGSFYRRHLDQFSDRARRQISCICYLNPQWWRADGGALRLEVAPGERISILPEAGTLVAFRSADFWHEVRRARRTRYSVTGWFLTREIGR